MGRRSVIASFAVFAAACVAGGPAGAQSLPPAADDERVPIAREDAGGSAVVARSNRAGEDRGRPHAPWAAAVFGGLLSGLFHWAYVGGVAAGGGQWEPWLVPTFGPVIAAGITVSECPPSSVCQDLAAYIVLGGVAAAALESLGGMLVLRSFGFWTAKQRYPERIPGVRLFATPGAGATPFGVTVGIVTF